MEQNLRRKARYIQHEHIYAGYDSSRRKRRLDRKARVPAQADNGKTLRKLPSNTRSSLILTTYSMSVREDLKCGYGLEIIKMKQILCVLAKTEAKVGAVESMKIIWIDVKMSNEYEDTVSWRRQSSIVWRILDICGCYSKSMQPIRTNYERIYMFLPLYHLDYYHDHNNKINYNRSFG